MNLIVTISEDVHIAAIRQARALDRGGALPADALNAMLDDEFRAWVSRVWDSVEAALRSAYSQGVAAARPLIEKANARLAECVETLADRIHELNTVISERLARYLQSAVEGALARIRSTVIIGDRELSVNGLTIEQRVQMTGSLKASLESICEFVANGEIVVSASYGPSS